MYFDTSVVLSLYVNDAFTRQAEDFYRHHAHAATVSAWVDLEVKSALAFLVRTKRLPHAKAQVALQTYETDRALGVYRQAELASGHFAAGCHVLSLRGALRAGDALHLGAAWCERLPLVTSDKTLHRAGTGLGVDSTYLPDF
ncbi:MAG TPA: type II toxin-antitoxin system VapC family toxin [Trueperaceae bacterium]